MRTIFILVFILIFTACNNMPGSKNYSANSKAPNEVVPLMVDNSMFIRETSKNNTIIEVDEENDENKDDEENDEMLDEPLLTEYKINLFTIHHINDENTVLVSFSDIYPNNIDEYSLVMPAITEAAAEANLHYNLDGNYRDYFLGTTNISETDTLFVYDYSANIHIAFAIRDLQLKAVPAYDGCSDPMFFLIGFAIDKIYIEGFGSNYRNTFAAVGKESPFAREGLIPIEWTEVSANEYPIGRIRYKNHAQIAVECKKPSTVYVFENDSLQYLLQNYLDNRNELCCRKLLVFNTKGTSIIEQIFYEDSPSLYLLNGESKEINQWTGKLLKGKSAVVLGFEYNKILVVDSLREYMYIKCDYKD